MTTDRLLLRRWQPKDLEPMAELNGSPEVMQYMLKTMSVQETSDWISRQERSFEKEGYALWAVEEKASAQLAGACGLYRIDWEAHFTPAVEIGWRFRKEFWGRGYATEAAKAALEYGFHRAGLKEIVAMTVPANLPSQRVMERLGMKRDLAGDFLHPKVPPGHPLQLHWLWRLAS